MFTTSHLLYSATDTKSLKLPPTPEFSAGQGRNLAVVLQMCAGKSFTLLQTWELWLPVGSLEKEPCTGQPLAAGATQGGCQGQELKSFRKVKVASALSFHSRLQGPLGVSV